MAKETITSLRVQGDLKELVVENYIYWRDYYYYYYY